MAFLSLDNFEDPDALAEESVEMTTVLGRLVGELWSRRDLEAQVRSEREAFRRQALHDPLTGVANRRSLEESLAAKRSSGQNRGYPEAILFVDLDDFKHINDRSGHEVGDQLLVHVATALTQVVRGNDIVARWGGDEFVVLPSRVESDVEAMKLSERILQHFERDLVLVDGRRVQVELTIGVGYCASARGDRSPLVRAADKAMYDAKAAGKGVARMRRVAA